jgi:hypothetical protein
MFSIFFFDKTAPILSGGRLKDNHRQEWEPKGSHLGTIVDLLQCFILSIMSTASAFVTFPHGLILANKARVIYPLSGKRDIFRERS